MSVNKYNLRHFIVSLLHVNRPVSVGGRPALKHDGEKGDQVDFQQHTLMHYKGLSRFLIERTA